MARIPSFLRGRKGGGDYKNTPDTIRSEDTVEVILGVGEGDNFGLAEGAKSFLMGGTALVNSNNEANFGDFQLVEYTGQSNPPAIVPYLGGFGSPKTANASSLAQNVPVIRTGELTQIDYIDLRFLISQLVRSNDKGTYTADLQLRVEYRKSQPAGSPWVPAWSENIVPPGYDENTGQSGVNVYSYGTDAQDYKSRLVTFEGDDVYLRNDPSPGAPTGDFPNVWVDPSTGRPSTYVGGTWTPVGTDTGDSWTYGTTKFYKNPQTPPPSPNVGDVWTPPNGSAPLKFNGSSWVLSLIGASINSKYAQPLLGNANGILSVQQKITSPVVREVRVPVPRANVPYDLRITKITPDTDSEGKYVSEVGWESFEEIVAEGRSFPNTHILHLIGTASDQFTQLPELLGDVKGRLIDVPTNYDPVTRTYTGVWDGLFKKAWTDNGAWATRDFIKNDRYGLSALYPLEVREASFYNWAVWCDQTVPDNVGGTRPRWTYNDDLSEPRQAKAQGEYMAGSCGGKLIDDGSGVYDVLVDRDEPMTMIFGPENIANDGEITYSFSDEQTRANWIKVGFINPEKDWAVDYRIVKDDDHIAEYGRIPLEFVATGKTNLSEALAAARLRLITGTTEFTAATWRTNRVGKYLFPFKVVGLCDPDMGWGISGRASAVTGARQIRLRDPIYLEAGLTHKFTFNLPTSPITTATVTVAPGQSGSLTVINFTSDLPALPEFPQFSVSTFNGDTPIATPKAFKILTITPADGDSEIVEITALELNRNKWAYVDGTGELLPAEEYTNFDQPLVSPQNVKLSPYIATAGGITRRSLQIQWDRPTNPFGRNTLIEYSSDGGEFTQIAESETEYYELKDLVVGTHAIRLTHVHVDGVHKSRPVVVVHEIGEVRNVPPVANVRLADEAQPNIYESISPMFRWDHGDEDPNFRTYRVRVRHPVNNGVVRTVDVPLREFIYEFDKNTADFLGTPSRAFKVTVTKVDDYGNESTEVSLSVNNPAPAAPVLTLVGVVGGVNIKLTEPLERDVIGARVRIDTVSTPLEQVFDGNQQQFFLELNDDQVRYVTAAYYDRFGKVGLNYSNQEEAQRQTISVGEIDTTPPAVPTGLTVTSQLVMDISGVQRIRLRAAWNRNNETDMGYYAVELTEAGGVPVVSTWGQSDVGVLPYAEWWVSANTAYSVRVAATDRVGNRSSYTSPISHTSTRDTVAPSAPTGVSATAFFSGIGLAATAPSEADVVQIQVFENTINNFGTATLIGSGATRPGAAWTYVRGGLAYNQTRYYWLRAVDSSGNQSSPSAVVSATAKGIDEADLTPSFRLPSYGDYGVPSSSTANAPNLPSTGNYIGRVAVNTNAADTKVYRFTNAGWSKAADGADILADTILGNRLVVNSLAGDRLQARTINVDKLVVAATDNLIANGSFLGDANLSQPAGWSRFTKTGGDFIRVAQGDTSWPVLKMLELHRVGNHSDELSAWTDPIAIEDPSFYEKGQLLVQPGDEFYVESEVFSTHPNIARLEVLGKYQAGNIAGGESFICSDYAFSTVNQNTVNINAAGFLKSVWTFKFIGTSPARIGLRVWNLGSLNDQFTMFGNMLMRRRNGGTMQIDGTLVARHIQVASLTGDRFQAATIEGQHIAARTIRVNNLLVVGSNLNPDPNFQDLSFWNAEAGGWFDEGPDANAGFYGRRFSLWSGSTINAPGSARKHVYAGGDQVLRGLVPLSWYRLRARFNNSSNQPVTLAVQLFDIGNNYIGGFYVGSAPGSGQAVVESAPYKVPFNTYWYRYVIYNEAPGTTFNGIVSVGEVELVQASDGKMVVDGTIEANHVKVRSLTGDRFQFNTLTGDLIAANTIQVRNLAIGNFNNIIPDGDYRDPQWWKRGGGSGATVSRIDLPDGNWSQPSGLLFSPNDSGDVYSEFFPVEPGATYKVTYRAWKNDAGANGFFAPFIHLPGYMWLNMKKSGAAGTAVGGNPGFDNDGSEVFFGGTDTGDMSFMLTIPSNVQKNIQFRFRQSATIGNVIFQCRIVRVSDQTLIGDGQIITSKLAVGAVKADRIDVAALSAISANLGVVTAGTLLIGPGGVTIQSAASGDRMVLSSSLLTIWKDGIDRVKIGFW